MVIMIGIDPHKATHTAVAIDRDEQVLEMCTVRASNIKRRDCESAGRRGETEPISMDRVTALVSHRPPVD